MIEKLTNSPFGLNKIFDALRILDWLAEQGLTTADVKNAKAELIKQHLDAVPESSKPKNPPKSAPKPPKTDTAVKKYRGKLRCPECGEMLYIENVCPACEEGRQGKKIRFNCGSCNYTEAI